MRVTSNLFPDTLQQQLNSLQTKQLRYQTQSSTGLKINEASDNPGDYSVAFDASGLASGVYLYRLVVDNFVDVKRMIVLK